MCNSCQVLVINNHRCHETGCPEAWKDCVAECKWCGSNFRPETSGQKFCDDSCYRAYNNLPDESDDPCDGDCDGCEYAKCPFFESTE